MYVYESRDGGKFWVVGFYMPSGSWYGEGLYSSQDEAAARVHYLNGGELPKAKSHPETHPKKGK